MNSFWRTDNFSVSYFALGRIAILAALRRLGAQEGETILLPAFVCSSLSKFLTNHGYRVLFFDSDMKSESFVESVLRFPIEDRKFVILVDFFGCMGDQINCATKALKKSGCLVIEDRCHSIFLSSFKSDADAVIFSLRKIIPTPDGAILLDKFEGGYEPQSTKFESSKVFILKILLENFFYSVGFINVYSTKVDLLRRYIKNINTQNGQSSVSLISKIPSKTLISHLCDSSILKKYSNKRRMNYDELDFHIKRLNFCPLFDVLDQRGSPYVYPVRDHNGNLARYLRSFGIGAFLWPGDDFPNEVEKNKLYPKANELKSQVVCLPVHHRLKQSEKNYIIKMLQKYSILNAEV